jgi:hypothetical protein
MYNPSLAPGGIARLALRTALFLVPLIVMAPGPLEADSFAGQRISEAGPTITQTVWKSNGEMVGQLMNCTGTYTPILSVTIPSVSAGQTLSIDADMEATEPYASASMLATYVTINGESVDDPQASNVSAEMHHMTVTRAAFWQARTNLKNVVVQLLARACDDTMGPNEIALQVNHGYGIVFVKVN